MSRDRPAPGDDYIDSRDVIRAIKELTDERDDLQEAVAAKQEEHEQSFTLPELAREEIGEELADAEGALEEWNRDNGEELAALESLQEQAEGYSEDWRYGAQLIRDDKFIEYAQQLAEDIGAIARDQQWPLNCIDWEEAAKELKMDYTSVEFGNYEYWLR